jgi:hypothetical protein
MSNEVAKRNVFGGTLSVANSAALASKIAESAQNDPRGGAGDSEYLNFSGKRGVYAMGPNQDSIDADEKWLVNVMSFEDGYVAWKGGQPAGNRMANIYSEVRIPAPDPDEGGPFDSNKGEGWFQAKAMTIKSLESGRQGYFKINSVSGVSALAQLQKEVAGRIGSGQPAWPVVQLDVERFESQGYKNYKPVFNIYGWIGDEQIAELAENEDADIDDLIAAANGPVGIEDQADAKPSRKRSSL